MTVTYARLFAPTQLTSATAAVCTVAAALPATVLVNGRVRFTNTDTAAHGVTAYAVASGASPASASCFANNISIGGNSYLDLDLPEMVVGDSLQAKSDATAVMSIAFLNGFLFS